MTERSGRLCRTQTVAQSLGLTHALQRMGLVLALVLSACLASWSHAQVLAVGERVDKPVVASVDVAALQSEFGLTVEDVQRYQSLLAGPRMHWSADAHPLMVLGVHARSEAERLRIAELLVEDDRKRTEAILALSRSVQQVWLRKYGSEALFRASAQAPAAASELLSTDRVLLAFKPGLCPQCNAAISRLQAEIVAHGGPGLDLYLVVDRDEEIQAFARQLLISPDAVRRKSITLNRADAAWLTQLGLPSGALPVAIRRRGTQLTPVNLDQLAKRRAWGGP